MYACMYASYPFLSLRYAQMRTYHHPLTDTVTQEPEAESHKLVNKNVSCRICKGDHWTSKCPYKDSMQVE